MKVVFVGMNYPPEVAGIAPYTAGVAEHLRAFGNDVEVITAFPHYPGWSFEAFELSSTRTEVRDGIAVRRVRPRLPRRKTSAWERILYDTSFALKASVLVLSTPANVYVVVSPPIQTALLIAGVAKLRRAKVILRLQDLPVNLAESVGMLRHRRLLRAAHAFERLVYAMVDRICAVSEDFAKHMAVGGSSVPQFVTIPDWADAPSAEPQPRNEGFRRSLGVPEGGLLVMHFGSMGAKQDLNLIVQAAKTDKARHWHFAVVGDGPARAKLESSVAKANLQNVHVSGPVPASEMLKTLTAADIFVLAQQPDVVDSVVPGKLISYMTAGRPIVAAVHADSTAAHILGEAGAGMIVPPGDSTGLSSAIHYLSGHTDVCDDLARAGTRYVFQKYRKDVVMSQWDDLLSSVLDRVDIKSAALGNESREP